MLSKEKVSEIVNTAFEGVNSSIVGPVFVYPDKNNITNKHMNQLAFGVYTIVLTAMMRGAIKDTEE